jgi:hypothetical protein
MSKQQLKALNLALIFLLGVYFTLEFVDFHQSASIGRRPSSIEPVYDYSSLNGEKLINQARKRLGDTLQVHTEKNKVAVLEIGNFVLQGDDGQKSFACGYFNRVAFVFTAQTGVSGPASKLVVEAPCQLGNNINEMAEINLAYGTMIKQEPSDFEQSFYSSGKSIKVKFENMGSKWPRSWQLEEVTLHHSTFAGRSLRVPASTKNIVMVW